RVRDAAHEAAESGIGPSLRLLTMRPRGGRVCIKLTEICCRRDDCCYPGNNHLITGKNAASAAPMATLNAAAPRQWRAAAPRVFCRIHFARLSYVVDRSTNARAGAPASAAREQEFRAPGPRPEPSLRDRDIHEQPSRRGLRPGRPERRPGSSESRSKERMALFRHLHDNAFLVF